MNGPTICVTGAGGPAGFNSIRSLRESALSPRIVAVDMDPLAAGLQLADSSYVVPPARSEEFVLVLLRILQREGVDVLIPTVDEEIAVLSREEIRNELSQQTGILIPNHSAAVKALDKHITVEECERANLPVPASAMVDKLEDLKASAGRIGLPVVVKPLRSRGARGISFVERISDLGAAWRKARHFGEAALIQEYVPGPVYTVGVVCDQRGEVAASIALEKIKQLPEKGGVAVAGRTVRNPKLQELGEKYVTSLGWIGPASPEIKLDERDGSFKLMEVNPRLFGYNYLAAKAGINLSEVTAMLAAGEAVSPLREYRADLYFVRSPHDIIIQEVPNGMGG